MEKIRLEYCPDVARLFSFNFKIELENGERLLVTPEQKVYGAVVNENNFFNSCVENTSTCDCFLNRFSFDHRGIRSLRANAKYGASLGCSGNMLFASERKLAYSGLGITSTTSHKSMKEVINSSSFIPQNLQILALSDRSSSNTKSGAYNLTPLVYTNLKSSLVNDSGLKNENITAASMTNSIHTTSPCLLATLSSSSSDSSLACSSVSLLFFNIASTALNNNNTLIFSSTASLNNTSVSGFSSSSLAISNSADGILTTNSGILINNINGQDNLNNFALLTVSELNKELLGGAFTIVHEITPPDVSNPAASHEIPDDTDNIPLWGETAQLNVTVNKRGKL